MIRSNYSVPDGLLLWPKLRVDFKEVVFLQLNNIHHILLVIDNPIVKSMQKHIKQITLALPNNAKDTKLYKLQIDTSKVVTGRQLKQKVADYLNYFPDCIYLQLQTKKNIEIEDKTDLPSLSIQNGMHFMFLLTERRYKRPMHVELTIGGFDLTDIQQLEPYFLKKMLLDHSELATKNRIPNGDERANSQPYDFIERRQDFIEKIQDFIVRQEEQIDLGAKYAEQLQQLKSILGKDQDETQLLAVLAQSNGDVGLAFDLHFQLRKISNL